MTSSQLRRSLFVVAVLAGSLPIALPGASVPARASAPTPVDCGTSQTPSVTTLANPNFYIDSGISPNLDANYGGYTVRAGTTAEPNLRIVLSNFTGGVITLADNQPDETTLPSLTAGEVTTSYFLFKATGPTTTPQTHKISLFRGGTYLCERNFTYTRVAETIKALANKVDSVTSSTGATVSIGSELVVTVEGRTGTLGAGPNFDPGILSYAPAAMRNFPANAWRLERTTMTISPDGVLGQTTYTNRLYLSGASGPDRPYVARYTFRAIDSSSSQTIVRPIQYIASGTQVKHTDVSGSVTGNIPTISDTSELSMTKSVTAVSPAFMAGTQTFAPVDGLAKGGRVRYTVTVSNSGGTSGTLDRIVDTMDAGLNFVEGSATISNRSRTPTLSGRDLIFYGPITIAAGSSINVVYDAIVHDEVGSYRNSVIGWFGSVRIDGSTSVNQQNPATTTVVVAPAYGAVSASEYITSTSPRTIRTVTAPKIMTLRQILGDALFNSQPNLVLSITRQPGGGTAELLQELSAQDGPRIRYTPDGVFGGVDEFEYSVTNGFTSASSTIKVRVPKAIYDQYVYPESVAVNQSFSEPASSGLIQGKNGVGQDICPVAPCVIKSATSSVGTLTLTPIDEAKEGAFTFTIAKNTIPGDGNINVTYILMDADGNEADGNARIVINNLGPDRAATQYKTAIPVDVLLNDDAKGNINGTSDVIGGTATVASSTIDIPRNHVIFTPNAGFVGIGEFTYTVPSRTGTARVLVAPPVSTITTTINTALSRTIGNTAYTTDFGQPISPSTSVYRCDSCVYSVTQPTVSMPLPTKGSISFTDPANGTFVYTPLPGSTGSDTFYYTVTEPTGITVNSSVTIQIGPDAVDDTDITVLAKNTASFDVLTNDNCPTTCTVEVLTSPLSGELTQTIEGGGAFTYMNSSSIGIFTFQYRITSSQTGTLSDTATVSITVEGARDDTAVTFPGVPITISIRANDPCDDCSLGSVSRPTIGTANVNTNGTVTYIPPSTFSGIASFTYTVTKDGKSTSARVTVTVRPDARNDSIAVLPNSSNNVIDVLNNDICADCVIENEELTATGGTASVALDGYSIIYDAPGSGGPFTFNYTIEDLQGNTDTASVTVTIATAPTVGNDSSSTFANQAVSIVTRTNDSCSDAPCSIEISSDPANGAASLSVNPNFDIVYVPNPSFTGIDSFTYSLVTSLGLRATATVTVIVSPVAVDDRAITGTNVAIGLNVLQNDLCATCEVTIIRNPTGGTITSVSGGTVTFTSPTPGTYSFDYTITETSIQNSVSSNQLSTFSTQSNPAEATATGTIIVGDASPDEASTPRGTPVDINVISNDTCQEVGCVVTSVNVSGGPANDSASILSDTTLRYTPDPTFSGLVTITYTATYDTTSTATAEVKILVGPAPLSRVTDKNVPVTGNLLTGMPCATCVVTLKSFSGVGEITIEENGDYTYTPQTDWLGTDSAIIYTITDSQSLSSPQISQDGTVVVTVDSLTPSLLVTKTGVLDVGSDNIVNVGDHVDYSYAVLNTYDRTLTNIVVTDDKIDNDADNIDCPSGGTTNIIATLAPGETVTCVTRYFLTQLDIDLGRITNTATASGSGYVPSIDSNEPAEDTDTITINLTRQASTSVVKSAGPVIRDASDPTTDKEGDTITYSYAAKNTGNVTLTNVIVEDDKIDNDAVNLNCPSGSTTNVITTLAPGETVTCVAVYTLTSADIAAGSVTNTATVTGTAPSGASNPEPSSSAITVLLNQPVSLSIEKTVLNTSNSPDNNDLGPGDVVTYSFLVTNTSTQATLTNITVADSKITSGITCDGGTGATISSLAPDAFTTCSATYTVTQTDINNGAIINTASVSSNYAQPGGVVSTITASDTNTHSVTQTPSVSITNTFASFSNAVVAPSGQTDSGDGATFTYVVTNTGNVTLTSLTVTGTTATTVDCGSGATISSIAPAGTATCSATHTITQSHIDAATLSNTGTVTSSFMKRDDFETTPVTASATTSTEITQTPTLSIANSGTVSKGVNSQSDAGESAVFTYAITNTGNVSLTSIDITSTLGTVDCDPGAGTSTSIASLSPSAKSTCTSTYPLTQGDIDTGHISDTAGASSIFTRANSTTTTVSDTDTATLNLDQSVQVSITNTFDSFDNSVVAPTIRTDAGDKVVFRYLITNTGNVTLSLLAVSTNAGTVDCDPGAGTSTTIASLEPGSNYTCYTTVVVTQTHIDVEAVSNTGQVVASYTYHGDSTPTTDTKTATAQSAIALSATLSITTNGVLDPAVLPNSPGDILTYTYTVTNTGNTTLMDIDVTVDDQDGDTTDNTISSPFIDCDGGTTNRIATLSPGASTTCSAPYGITQAQIDRGFVRNNVVATTSNALATYKFDKPINQHGKLSVSNTARDIESSGETGPDVGDTIVYDVVVTNTGNVTLANITVAIPGLSFVCSPITSLAPGASVTCASSPYALTQNDLDAESVSKIAEASTTFTYYDVTKDENISDSDSATSYIFSSDTTPSLTLTKTGILNNSVVSPSSQTNVGDTITYTFTVINNGTIDLVNVEVTDLLIDNSNISCDGTNSHIIASLVTNQTKTCTATYVITQAEIDIGSLTNTASVESGSATDIASVTTTFVQEPSMTIDKSGVLDNSVISPSTETNAGDYITYQYVVTNTGNVTLSNITVTDDKIQNASSLKCPRITGTNNVIGALAPGSTVTCEVIYTVTAFDVTAGSVTNTATATANKPDGTAITPATDSLTITLTPPVNDNVTADVEANDDSVSAPMGAILDIDVLSNDTGEGLTVVSASDPTNGTTEVKDGVVRLIPDITFTGSISFNYVMTDGNSVGMGSVTVSMTENATKPNPEIFLDMNANGRRDTGEPGIKNIDMALQLESRATMTVSSGSPAKITSSTTVSSRSLDSRVFRTSVVSFSTTLPSYSCATLNTGFCASPRLPIGSYIVKANFVPSNFGLTTTADTDGVLDLQARSVPFGNSMTDVQFGVAGLGSIQGHTYVDRNNNNQFNPRTDRALPNSRIQIVWAGIDRILGTEDDVVISTTTDANGWYSVTNIPAGEYIVRAASTQATVTLSGRVIATLRNNSIRTVDFRAIEDRYLPATGVHTGRIFFWISLLLFGGVTLMKFTRRRPTI